MYVNSVPSGETERASFTSMNFLGTSSDGGAATFTVDGLEFLPRGVTHTMFSISERVTGDLDLSACGFPQSWRVWRAGDSWKMLYNMGTIMIFK